MNSSTLNIKESLLLPPPNPPLSSEPPPSSPLREERWRLFNVFLYVVLSGLCDIQFFGISLVTTQICHLYGVSLSLSFFYSSAFLISPIVFSLPAGILTSNKTIKMTLVIGTGITLLGSWLKVLINSSFYFSLIGQLIVAAAYPFFKNGLTKMSSQWFTAQNRTVATSFLNSAGAFINIISMYLPTLAINTDTIPTQEMNYYRDRMAYQSLIFAFLATLVGAVCLLFYKETPAQPVSRVSSIQRLTIKESISHLCKNISMLYPIIAGSLAGGVAIAYQIIVEAAFRKYGSSTLSIRDYTLLSGPLLVIFSLIVSFFSGRYGIFKGFLIAGNILHLGCTIMLLFFYTIGQAYIFGISFIFTTVAFACQSSIGIEFISELCFPIPEPFVISLTLFCLKVLSLSIVQVSSFLIQTQQLDSLMAIFLFLVILSTVLFFISREKLHRRELDTSKSSNE